MMRRRQSIRASVVAALVLALAEPGRAQSSSSEPPAGDATANEACGNELPVSLDRIRAALERAPESRLKLPGQPNFSITIEGRQPRIEGVIDLEEIRQGPAMPMSSTHQEFLAMVTPPEARAFGAFSPGQLAVVAATAFATGLAVNTLPSLIRDALRRRQEEQAKREVAELLAELERQKAQEPREP